MSSEDDGKGTSDLCMLRLSGKRAPDKTSRKSRRLARCCLATCAAEGSIVQTWKRSCPRIMHHQEDILREIVIAVYGGEMRNDVANQPTSLDIRAK
jgi:hypothetical protein